MKKKIITIGIIVLLLAVVGSIFVPPLIFAFGMLVKVSMIERSLCSQNNYEQVAKDLAIICSNIQSDTYTSDVDILWWPDSVRKLEPLHGYLNPDKASVLFTRGFSHLSYQLEKIDDGKSNSSKWSLSFADEGRTKHLTTIELSQNEPINFDDMLEEAASEYDRLIKENPDSSQLKQQKEKFLSLFVKTETSQQIE